MSTTTVNKYRIATGERVATFRVTFELTAEEIGTALAASNGDAHGTVAPRRRRTLHRLGQHQ